MTNDPLHAAIEEFAAEGYTHIKGWLPSISPFWSYVGGALLLVVPWIWYWRQWHKNAEEFTPEDCHPTDEAIRREWEIKYLTRRA